MISAKRVSSGSRLRRVLFALALIALPAAALPAAAAAATAGPAWAIASISTSPTNFAPGDSSGKNLYNIEVTNIGSKATDGSPVTITDILPPGLTVKSGGTAIPFQGYNDHQDEFPCEPGPPARCFASLVVHPGEKLYMRVPVNVAPDAPPIVTNQVSVSGGGAPGAASSVQTPISSAPAVFGLQDFYSSLIGVDGDAETRSGAHPYKLRIGAQFNTNNPNGAPAENPRDIVADLPAGLVVNPRATPVRCSEAQLQAFVCPDASAIGIAHITLNPFGFATPIFTQPLYNMVPPQGRPASLAFNVNGFGIDIHLLGRVRSDGDYGLSSDTFDIPQVADMSGVSVELWGNPSDPSHDYRRGNCSYESNFGKTCPAPATEIPFLTMPSNCSGSIATNFTADSWQNRGDFVSASDQTRDAAGDPVAVAGCDKLEYTPQTETQLSTGQAETGTGFDLNLDLPNNGWNNQGTLAESTTKKAVVTLPEGMTINPSVGEGLGSCRPDQYNRETTFSVEGEGCPGDSKVGTVQVDTPLLDKGIDGSVYLAQQDNPLTSEHGAENPFDSDVALYLVLRNAQLGVLVKQEMKVEPDSKTGQLTATVDEIPQLPFSHFNFHFREGARAALVTPPTCGKYTTVAKFYPWSDPTHARTANSSFEIAKGVGGGPCPSGGIPPFHPDFQAGSVNNNAGSFSPFNMRLIRHDGEQDMTKFSSILPPGELGSLAGVGKCSEGAVAAAKAKTGRQELASPSCPANSLIGHTVASAGVGDALTNVKGQLYLAGPYNGDPLSVISITPALAGPFDAGTVVVRLALNLNPKTAEVEVDGDNSDPIPHILKGIVLKVRDLRVLVDRPDFTLNPTSCAPSSAKAKLFGAYLDVFNPADDVPVDLATRYQAASCASLGYKPSLGLKLQGGTRRGGHPGLLATYTARNGDANTRGIVVRLPRSAFLDQAHIRTICTRVQFAAKNCPPAAQYGYIKAWTPLLDEPLQGPVYLRSSNHKLPDLVFDLHGLVDVEVSTRIDSVNGGIRATVEDAPDAPLSKVLLRMQGGKKGLIVNSRNLCGAKSRANVTMTGQNGKQHNANPPLVPDCGGKRKHKQAGA